MPSPRCRLLRRGHAEVSMRLNKKHTEIASLADRETRLSVFTFSRRHPPCRGRLIPRLHCKLFAVPVSNFLVSSITRSHKSTLLRVRLVIARPNAWLTGRSRLLGSSLDRCWFFSRCQDLEEVRPTFGVAKLEGDGAHGSFSTYCMAFRWQNVL